MKQRVLVPAVLSGVLAVGLWWRRHPSACPYSQRFWVESPHPFITLARLREALTPQPGERVLEVGPGTGYYSCDVATWVAPDGKLDIFDLQPEMLDHTMRRARERALTNVTATQGDAQRLPYGDVGELFGDPHWVAPATLRDRGERAGLRLERRVGRLLGHFSVFRK